MGLSGNTSSNAFNFKKNTSRVFSGMHFWNVPWYMTIIMRSYWSRTCISMMLTYNLCTSLHYIIHTYITNLVKIQRYVLCCLLLFYQIGTQGIDKISSPQILKLFIHLCWSSKSSSLSQLHHIRVSLDSSSDWRKLGFWLLRWKIRN